jgi:RNA polymerase sigma factor (sigma-70 family)
VQPGRAARRPYDVGELNLEPVGASRSPDRRSGIPVERSTREPVDEAYARMRPGLLRLAHLLTGSPELAEDIVHDAFIACVGKWPSIDLPDAYVRRAVVNQANSALRSLGRDRTKAERLAGRATVSLAEPDLDETWSLLRRLPDRQRMALVLRFYDDRTEAEIAEMLGCRCGTVKSLIHRGLAKVRREIVR